MGCLLVAMTMKCHGDEIQTTSWKPSNCMVSIHYCIVSIHYCMVSLYGQYLLLCGQYSLLFGQHSLLCGLLLITMFLLCLWCLFCMLISICFKKLSFWRQQNLIWLVVNLINVSIKHKQILCTIISNLHSQNQGRAQKFTNMKLFYYILEIFFRFHRYNYFGF